MGERPGRFPNMPQASPGIVMLRDVEEADLPVFFEHQREPDANRMAAFPARERDAFFAHWREKVLGNESNRKKTIVVGDEVVGYVDAVVCLLELGVVIPFGHEIAAISRRYSTSDMSTAGLGGASDIDSPSLAGPYHGTNRPPPAWPRGGNFAALRQTDQVRDSSVTGSQRDRESRRARAQLPRYFSHQVKGTR